MDIQFAPLTIVEYAQRASAADQRNDNGSRAFPMLGLFGEVGSLLSALKKKQRDRASYLGYAATVVEELGDTLWYLATVAERINFALETVFEASGRLREGSTTFADLQSDLMPLASVPTEAFERTLLRLAGEVGRLVSECEHRPNRDPVVLERLGAVARVLVQAADEASVTLEAAAVKNLAKIEGRWPQVRSHQPHLDEAADAGERLPRHLVIDVLEREVRGQTYVFQRCNGINIGDRLTDNAARPDDYRFHDVFHYAYVAVLGWSPVVRSLLRLKRKSDPEIDEVQDGARATLIEEGISTWIFSQAKELEFFKGLKAGDLSFDLLKQVQQFVTGYEVDEFPLWLWEDAILQGFRAFRFLRTHRKGRVTIDMNRRLLVIDPLE